ncbi:hypothetical protein TCAL_10560, partial [Tigriopus californicus]|eukprot:TCALIF_10560-PA protein Name:"Similar to trpa-1 Transient receptor potential cation channel subfamily A member 1 homolog (Caenorhabditis elegans)" AED:0.06 eAED:0.06 QI:273/1/0.5/1/1/0.5/2/0/1090
MERIPLMATNNPNKVCAQLSCQDAQSGALEALKRNDLTLFSSVLAEECNLDDAIFQRGSLSDDEKKRFLLPLDHWINQPILEEGEKTLLQVAVHHQNVDFTRTLLACGARANLFNDDLDNAPIHNAVDIGSLEHVVALLENPFNKADPNITVQPSGRTAVHLAVEQGRLDILERLLQEPNINVNAKDNQGQNTPLFLAAKKKNGEAVKLLLEHGASLTDLVGNRSVKTAIRDNLPYFDISQVIVKEKVRENTLDYLQEMLERRDLAYFKAVLHFLDPSEVSRQSVKGFTILQRACIEGLDDYVQVLLSAGVGSNLATTENNWRPVLLAAARGHYDVLEVFKRFNQKAMNRQPLTNFGVWTTDTRETILHLILKKSFRRNLQGISPTLDEINHWDDKYTKSLEVLLEDTPPSLRRQLELVINKKDKMGNSPIHYAVQYWPQDIVRQLMQVGANIGQRNWRGEIPLHKIDPQTLANFLDEDCVTCPEGKDPTTHDDFSVTFHYDFLAPPIPEEHLEQWDDEKQIALEKEALPETDTIWFISQSPAHRHLIKHPVITSFLWLKWQRIRRFFNRNMRFYAFFVIALTWYVFARFGGHSLQLRGPIGSSKSELGINGNSPPQFCSAIGWAERSYGDFWYILFAIHCVIQLILISRDWTRDLRCSSCSKWVLSVLSSWPEIVIVGLIIVTLWMSIGALWLVLTLLLGLLILRESFQMASSMKRYFLCLENWIELSLITLVGVIMFIPDSVMSSQMEESCDIKRHMGAVALLLAWAELITMVGRHPRLARYNIFVTMFYKVLKTFFYFLTWYSFFLVAFGLGFYIMLHQDTNRESGTSSAEHGDEAYAFFNSPWLALVKTSTMFVGEIEFSDIPINLEGPLAPVGYLFLLAFVFLIVVVLMNLLNGLAVSDTGAIQEEAEIVGYISRVETISYAESILLGDPFDFLSQWAPISWVEKCPSGTLIHSLYSSCPALKRLSHKLTGATGILLFFSYLTTKEETFPLRKRPQDSRDDEAGCRSSCCHQEDGNYEDVLSAARNILIERVGQASSSRQSDDPMVWKKILDKQDLLVRLIEKQSEEVKHLRNLIKLSDTTGSTF